jgi:cation transport ATPase
MTGAADIIIMSPNLDALPKIINIAKMTINQTKWNIKWAIGYNVVAVSLAFGVFERWGLVVDACVFPSSVHTCGSSLLTSFRSLAGTLMAFSSLTILGMSLHLRRRLS